MEVVLLPAVEKLGPAGAVVKVKPGYARNYLLPRGLAAAATPQQLALTASASKKQQEKTQRLAAEAEAIKHKLESQSVTLTLQLGADQKAFGSVTAHDIAEALTQLGIPLEKHAVRLEQPIKTLGIHEVPVRVQASVTATVKVSVVKA